ncbi:winged helix-turn-helix transcriptional regulator [Foetidibacter luteolus]|uniref:winged helix-turn-helix transcriptional regulator n=1 Tax=Foetidibacter luteolus TaxID=2608880 RepID=UPI00129A7AEC|nr:helix-turn-helix domain-containing protein [Foetidibacter luteolus]
MPERKLTSTNYRNQSFLEEKCALNEMLDLLSKRWITDILFAIEEGHNRFSAIRTELKYISDAVLSDRLKLLEKATLIVRRSFDEIPVKVEYSITEKGSELSSLLDELCHFSETVFHEIAETDNETVSS